MLLGLLAAVGLLDLSQLGSVVLESSEPALLAQKGLHELTQVLLFEGLDHSGRDSSSLADSQYRRITCSVNSECHLEVVLISPLGPQEVKWFQFVLVYN